MFPLYIRSHRDLPPPVIIIGMHRSGTSILSRMLQECGLFIGKRLDPNFESHYFRAINKEILARAGADWNDPEPYLRRRRDEGFRAECAAMARERLEQSFGARFIGSRSRSVLGGQKVREWAWKDPRTCLTLDVWGDVFPDARYLHVYRHPLDVAISLQRREEKRRSAGEAPVANVESLDHDLKLWDVYVAECLKCRGLGERYYELKYEEFMPNAAVELERIARFCGLTASAERVRQAAGMADTSRTRRYDDERYAPWREKVGALGMARELGYE